MSHLFLLLQRNQCLATIIIGICKMRAEAREMKTCYNITWFVSAIAYLQFGFWNTRLLLKNTFVKFKPSSNMRFCELQKFCKRPIIFTQYLPTCLTGSGVFKGRRARHLSRAPLFGGPPVTCYPCKFSLFLMKNLLFTHIMYYKANHK